MQGFEDWRLQSAWCYRSHAQDGGSQERALAKRYRSDAEALRFDWHRTAACLDRIATTYEVDANREDLSAEQRDWL